MQLHVPPGDFAGYIFDLDGTLIDSMPVHYRAWDAALRQAGMRERLDEDFFYSLGGVPTRRVAELLAEHHKLKIDPDQMFHTKEAIFTEMLPKVTLVEPVVAIARRGGAHPPGERGLGWAARDRAAFAGAGRARGVVSRDRVVRRCRAWQAGAGYVSARRETDGGAPGAMPRVRGTRSQACKARSQRAWPWCMCRAGKLKVA